MQIGDKVSVEKEWMEKVRKGRTWDFVRRETAVGTVVWIHPKSRFAVAEFTFPGGTYRESIPMF